MSSVENKDGNDLKHFELLQAVYYKESQPGKKFSQLEPRQLQSLIAMILTRSFIQSLTLIRPECKVYFERVLTNWRSVTNQESSTRLVSKNEPSNVFLLKTAQ